MPMVGIGIGLRQAGGKDTPASLTAAWAARVIGRGGTVSAGTEAAMLAFLTSLDAVGVMAKILRLNMMVGSNLAAALTPVIVRGGNAADTNVNFLEADYAETGGAAGGLRGGTGRYLDTGLILPAGILGGFMVRNQTAATPDANFCGVTQGTSHARLYKDGHPNTVSAFGLDASKAGFSVAAGGNWRATRKSSIFNRVAKNTSGATSVVPEATALPTIPVFVFARNLNGAASGFATAYRFSGYWIDDGTITDASEATLNTAINTFSTAVGR